MTFAKSILLGSAAALAMAGGGQAADLPLAEPVEYVKVCNTYGAGFFYIPGSDTCLQIGGYARAQYFLFDDGGSRQSNTNFNTQVNLGFDARTETEYGTLRSYVRLEFTRFSGNAGSSASTGGKLVEFAFVQFAGLTAGLTTSFFDFYANSNIFTTVAGSDSENALLAYTATFGSGFSATISLEDNTNRRWMDGFFNGTGVRFGNAYAEQEWPDIVANLRVEQGWGAAQLSGVLHDNNNANGRDKTGWAVQAGVKVNLPVIAEGDQLILQAAYADGALAYLAPGLGFDYFGYRGGQYSISDNFGPGGDRSEGFVFAGEFLHYWQPNLRSALAASYSDIDVGRGAGFDFKEYMVAGNLVWTPVKKLDIGVEVGYSRLDYDNPVLRRIGRTNTDTTDTISGVMRVRRDF